MVTVALLGVLSVAPPLGLESSTLKASLPESAADLLMATVKLLEEASPLAQSKVPLVAVKFVPATAVPSAVA